MQLQQQSNKDLSISNKFHISKRSSKRVPHYFTYANSVPGPSPAGGRWGPAPRLKSVPPHFMFGPPVAAYIQYCILKRCPPLLVLAPPGFWPLLLLHPDDGLAQYHAQLQYIHAKKNKQHFRATMFSSVFSVLCDLNTHRNFDDFTMT